MAEVTLTWDGRRKAFDLDKLETAWLVRQDVDPTVSPLALSRVVADHLRDVLGWPYGDSIEYAIASGKWNPEA